MKSDRPGNEPVLLGLILLASLIQGLVGIAKYGYCGQDFQYHHDLLVNFPQGFSYKFTNPPGIYAVGQLVGTLISRSYMLELTAFVFLVCNTLALWPLYSILKRIILNEPIRYAAMLLATFVPFRVVHSLVFAADAATVPIFVLLAYAAIRLFEQPELAMRSWIAIGVLLTVGLLFKYTFIGLLPALALVALHDLAYIERERVHWVVAVTAGICLAVPLIVFLIQMDLSRQLGGVTAVSQWLAPGQEPEMNARDILHLKTTDIELLRAPQYFQDRIYEPHKYSYVSLVHLAMFTDVLNYFQRKPSIRGHAVDHGRQRDGSPRRELSRTLSPVAVAGSLPFSVASLAGTAIIMVAGLARLLLNKGKVGLPLAVVAALAAGFYAPVILNITKMVNAYTAGYWLPRLVMPALLTFLILGFVLLDWLHGPPEEGRPRVPARVCLVYTAAMCVVFVAIT